MDDTGLKSVEEIARLMEDRKLWRAVVAKTQYQMIST